MKQLSLLFVILFLTGSVRAEDIFKKHGFDEKPLTLSKGQYQETFANDEVVQIGTVLLDTRMNRIVRFLDEDTAEPVQKAEYSSRWLTPDPLAEKYYSISPYAYCLNNPINFIDPTGMAPIFDEDGNLLGTDADGWKGTSIVMNKDRYTEGMSNKEALKAGTKLNEYGKGIKISDKSWTAVTDNGGERMDPYIRNNSENTVYYKPEEATGDYEDGGAYAVEAGKDMYMRVDGVKTQDMKPDEVFKIPDYGRVEINSEGKVEFTNSVYNLFKVVSKAGIMQSPAGNFENLRRSYPILRDSPIIFPKIPGVHRPIISPKS